MKVLVVEDEPLAETLLRDMLSAGLGCEVYTANNVSEGLQALEDVEGIGLIICDINLPDSSGIELIKKVRQEPELRGIPLLVCTGHKNEELLANLRELGFRHCIGKPVNRDLLRGSLRVILGEDPELFSRRMKVLLALDLELAHYREIQADSQGALRDILETHFPSLSQARVEDINQLFWPCAWDLDSEANLEDESLEPA